MPKGTLEFDLADPEDRDRFAAACNGEKMVCAIEEFMQLLRTETKYKDHSGKALDLLTSMRQQAYELFREFTP